MLPWGGIAGPGDYTEVISRQLSFQPGTTQLCAPINITDDAILEDSETFSVQLNTTDQAVILDPISSTITILDSDSESGSISYQFIHYIQVLYVTMYTTPCMVYNTKHNQYSKVWSTYILCIFQT